MPSKTLKKFILGLMFVFVGGSLLADEVDSLREKAKAIQAKAKVLAEEGNKKQAERLEMEAVQILKMAERQDSKTVGKSEKVFVTGVGIEAAGLKERLRDLMNKERKMRESKVRETELAEIHEQIANTERALKKLTSAYSDGGEHRPEFRDQIEKLEATARRIKHYRVAAENLKMVEEHELARKLMVKAEDMERDVQNAKQRLAAQMDMEGSDKKVIGPEAFVQLKNEIERLRAEVRELKLQLEKR